MTKKTIELVVYTVSEQNMDGFNAKRSAMANQLTSYSGYVSGFTFKDTEKAGTFLDYIVWDNEETALAAVNDIKTDQACAPFIEAIEQVLHSAHYTLAQDTKSLCVDNFDHNTIVEFALGEVKADALQTVSVVKPQLFDIVRQQQGLLQITSAVQTDNEKALMDVLCWASAEQMGQAMEVIHQTEQCQTFMSTFEKDVFYGHLQLING
ncbi:MAG: hypothetical protein MJK04_37800 [Psychrosphaera sp.]|nr:hypothetical protein [Psychrosphaera sp.]